MLDNLNIRLHLVSGETVVFHADGEEAVRNILAQTWRGKFFTQPSLIIANPAAVNVFPGPAILRVDLLSPTATDALNELEVGHDAPSQGQEVTEEEWQAATKIVQREVENEHATLPTEGEAITAYGRFSLSDDEHIYLRFEITAPNQMELRRFFHNLFTLPIMAFHNTEGGVSLINPARLVRCVFYPGAEPPLGAWHAYETVSGD